MPLHQLFGFFFFSLLLNRPYLSPQVFLAFAPLILSPILLGWGLSGRGSYLPAGIHPSHSSSTSGNK